MGRPVYIRRISQGGAAGRRGGGHGEDGRQNDDAEAARCWHTPHPTLHIPPSTVNIHCEFPYKLYEEAWWMHTPSHLPPRVLSRVESANLVPMISCIQLYVCSIADLNLRFESGVCW
jgi:hypothetical protein